VSEHIVRESKDTDTPRKNRVIFSGTHEATQGLEQMVAAWQMLKLDNWELHIAGAGPITPNLQKLASNNGSIVFHGFLNSQDNARLLCSGRIGMNPQDTTKIPGTSFAFKIIEYLAAGLHVITTPRGAVERDLEAGISYIQGNTPEEIAHSLVEVIGERRHERTASRATLDAYGPEAVSKGLNRLIHQVTSGAIPTLSRRESTEQ
jgi:glycosyltransferase involved in cell wall biosynthesis